MDEECRPDDLSIIDEDGLLRRIPNWPSMYVWDHNIDSYRPSTANFKDSDLSVSLEKDLLDAGNDHNEAVKNHPDFGLLKVSAGFVRNELANQQAINRDPVPEDPYHALVFGKKSKGDCRKLVEESEVVIAPAM